MPSPKNKIKLPAVASDTKILSFDLESNGLHGQAFAVGAVVVDMQGEVLDKFTARVEIVGELDDWVAKNVIPFIEDMSISHKTYNDMCSDFWTWFVKAQELSDYVVVQNGYPVEYSFLLDCQNQDLNTRYWQHPFPILDITSMQIQAGLSPEERIVSEKNILKQNKLSKHHPLHDAQSTALQTVVLVKPTIEN